jgi:aminoglycoside phosphotransferase (APT) family kinase protein
MDLAAGHSLLSDLNGVAAIRRLPALFRRLPIVLADAQARLHRLDPAPIERALEAAGVARPDVPTMLASLREASEALGRADLVAAAAWLQTNQRSAGGEVACHGDLHPFNVLVDDDGRVTVLDWSAALLAPNSYDLAFTSLVLSEPPMVVPAPLRPLIRAAGRALARRFVRAYERAMGETIDKPSLEWHQSLVCLRALVEAANWVADGTIADRAGHPWVLSGAAFADRLGAMTRVLVRPR